MIGHIRTSRHLQLDSRTGGAEGPQNARVAAEIGSMESEVETDSEVGAKALL